MRGGGGGKEIPAPFKLFPYVSSSFYCYKLAELSRNLTGRDGVETSREN